MGLPLEGLDNVSGQKDSEEQTDSQNASQNPDGLLFSEPADESLSFACVCEKPLAVPQADET